MVNADDDRKKLRVVNYGHLKPIPAMLMRKTKAANDNLAAKTAAPFSETLKNIANAFRANAQCEKAGEDMQSAERLFCRSVCSHQSWRAVPVTIGRIVLMAVCVFWAIFGSVTDSES